MVRIHYLKLKSNVCYENWIILRLNHLLYRNGIEKIRGIIGEDLVDIHNVKETPLSFYGGLRPFTARYLNVGFR